MIPVENWNYSKPIYCSIQRIPIKNNMIIKEYQSVFGAHHISQLTVDKWQKTSTEGK